MKKVEMAETNKENLTKWLVIVLTVAILLCVGLFFSYPPVLYSNTASYRRSAQAVLGGFEAYDGTRTPGYPVWMALIGSDQMTTTSSSQMHRGDLSHDAVHLRPVVVFLVIWVIYRSWVVWVKPMRNGEASAHT
jgi:hypothetical protein